MHRIMLESTNQALPWLCLICIVLSLFGCIYSLVAGWAVRRLAKRAVHSDPTPKSVTILKPVCGLGHNLW
jgi:NhaP-type Na+/H+ or K+/H+ antiporter